MFTELFICFVFFLPAQMVPKTSSLGDCFHSVPAYSAYSFYRKIPNFLLLVIVFIMLLFSSSICDTEVFYAYSFV
jgi:hypothetical protein